MRKRLREEDAINILDWLVGVDSYMRHQGARVKVWRLTAEQSRELATIFKVTELHYVLGKPIAIRGVVLQD